MLEYLHKHILEELEGAVDYWEKALEHKGTEWGCKFRMMAEMELEHANAMLKMMNATEKPKSVTDAAYAEMQKDVLKAYADSMGKIEPLKKLYWKE